MKRRILTAAVLVLFSGLAWAAESAQPAAKARPEPVVTDTQDLVYLGEDRPVFIRLHIQRDGKPFQEPWNAYLKELFKYLDRDGDGVLSKDEAVRVPSGQQLLQQLRGYFPYVQGQASIASFQDLDANKDGQVTLDELAAYYQRTGAGPLQMSLPPGNAAASDALTEALFKALDENKDGKLSREELARADKVLQQFDLDDDDLISAQELGGGPFNPYPYAIPAVAVARLRGGMARPQVQADFFPVHRDASRNQQVARAQLVHQLLTRYDKDKNQQLSREEVGLDKATFDRLDTNHDGQLNAAELMMLLRQPPHLELVVRLGKTADKLLRVDFADPKENPSPLASAVSKLPNGTAAIALSDARINVQSSGVANAVAIVRSYRQFYVAQFKAADTNKDNVLDLKEIQKSRAQFYLRPLMQLADRDGDGKLSLQELNAYLDLLEKGAGCMTNLTVNNNGRGLFAILDANGDGQLSIRELRTSWSRVAAYDRTKKGHITRKDIPLQFQVTVGASQQANGFGRVPVATNVGVGPAPRRVSANDGPLWFRKMDRNGDGDVSPREFLGSREDFNRIDTDGDGLISLEEAKKADEWFRKRLAKQE